MTQDIYVLDTNVLLHDPQVFQRFEGEKVVIPVTVLEELDRLKKFTDELGKNARHALRFIDGLGRRGDLDKGVKFDDKGELRVVVDMKNGRSAFPLHSEHRAHRVLQSAYELKEKEKAPVVVVSKDFLVRVKAGALGLKSQDYKTIRESYDSLFRGLRKFEVEKSLIDQFYAEGSLKLEMDDLIHNEYCVMTSPENSSAVARFNKKKNHLEPLLPLSRDTWGVHPLNVEQRCALDLLLRDDVQLVSLIGPAGTGKTLLSLACGMKKVFDEDVYTKILVSRPIMPLGKDIGYLPGTKEEKLYHWMQPIYDNLEFLCENLAGESNAGETQSFVLQSKKIEMEAVTYIRGRTLPKMYIIIDEAQNLTPHEIKTIISRAGKGTKVILMGDPTQIDNPYLDKDSNALTYIVGRFKGRSLFGHVFLEKTERSELAALATEVL